MLDASVFALTHLLVCATPGNGFFALDLIRTTLLPDLCVGHTRMTLMMERRLSAIKLLAVQIIYSTEVRANVLNQCENKIPNPLQARLAQI